MPNSEPRDGSQLYADRRIFIWASWVRLPDHALLLRELRILERQVHPSGKDSVNQLARALRNLAASMTLGAAALPDGGGDNGAAQLGAGGSGKGRTNHCHGNLLNRRIRPAIRLACGAVV